ncbi:MAG: LruC domain-containing protein [Leptospiraceae bacterium]|nr:LruC domain-containing protein [Leptospiraceae bacterium]MCP5494389.1 LruC domain-containing protein [Leptospiraceae bacterium]
MKTQAKLIVIMAFIALSLIKCETALDPNYKWLMSLTQPPGENENAQVVGEAAVDPGSSTVVAPVGEQEFELQVSDITGTTDFIFDTTKTITIQITVVDPIAPVSGCMVRFLDVVDPVTSRVIFKAVTDGSGNVKGSFTVNSTTNQVRLVVDVFGETIIRDINIGSVKQINRTLTFLSQTTPVTIIDSDNDGVADEEDFYPNDPSRATKINYPSDGGYYTIAFEDLFPKQGDADFNDYVVRAKFEEDLNTEGKVVRIRGNFLHIAKGAGYNHTFHLNLPNVTGATYTLKRYKPDGSLEFETTKTVESFMGVEVMPNSSTTLSSSNSNTNQTLVLGKKGEIEIVLANPISKLDLGPVPYDPYLYVINTKKEIHFAGKYFKEDGTDIYIDPTGFPWALMIPGDWQWPYERGNIHEAYLDFRAWYTSEGNEHNDWYNFPVTGKVFPIN